MASSEPWFKVLTSGLYRDYQGLYERARSLYIQNFGNGLKRRNDVWNSSQAVHYWQLTNMKSHPSRKSTRHDYTHQTISAILGVLQQA